MPQSLRGRVVAQINNVIVDLIEAGLAIDQNFAYQRRVSAINHDVIYGAATRYGTFLRNVYYRDTYGALRDSREYNVLMPDGALLQLIYSFADDQLVRHRLAFLPSPDLTDYQEDPNIYESDLVFAEVASRRVLPVPVRFDYDVRPGITVDMEHPASHLTLGQYRGCRIPVTAGVSPYAFFDFVLRNFYAPAAKEHGLLACLPKGLFGESITLNERRIVSLRVPDDST